MKTRVASLLLLAGWVFSSLQLSLLLSCGACDVEADGLPHRAACLGALAVCCLQLSSVHVMMGVQAWTSPHRS